MTVLFNDTFSGTHLLSAHTSDSGHTWVTAPDGGTDWIQYATVAAGTLKPTTPSAIYIVQPNIVCPDNFELEIVFDKLSGKYFDCGVYFDYDPAYYDYRYSATTGLNQVWFGNNYTTDGISTQNSVTGYVVASPAVTYTTASHTIKIHRVGSVVSVYLDDVLKITRTNMAPSAGTGLAIFWDNGSAAAPLIPITRVTLNDVVISTEFWTNLVGTTQTYA